MRRVNVFRRSLLSLLNISKYLAKIGELGNAKIVFIETIYCSISLANRIIQTEAYLPWGMQTELDPIKLIFPWLDES